MLNPALDWLPSDEALATDDRYAEGYLEERRAERKRKADLDEAAELAAIPAVEQRRFLAAINNYPAQTFLADHLAPEEADKMRGCGRLLLPLASDPSRFQLVGCGVRRLCPICAESRRRENARGLADDIRASFVFPERLALRRAVRRLLRALRPSRQVFDLAKAAEVLRISRDDLSGLETKRDRIIRDAEAYRAKEEKKAKDRGDDAAKLAALGERLKSALEAELRWIDNALATAKTTTESNRLALDACKAAASPETAKAADDLAKRLRAAARDAERKRPRAVYAAFVGNLPEPVRDAFEDEPLVLADALFEASQRFAKKAIKIKGVGGCSSLHTGHSSNPDDAPFLHIHSLILPMAFEVTREWEPTEKGRRVSTASIVAVRTFAPFFDIGDSPEGEKTRADWANLWRDSFVAALPPHLRARVPVVAWNNPNYAYLAARADLRVLSDGRFNDPYVERKLRHATNYQVRTWISDLGARLRQDITVSVDPAGKKSTTLHGHRMLAGAHYRQRDASAAHLAAHFRIIADLARRPMTRWFGAFSSANRKPLRLAGLTLGAGPKKPPATKAEKEARRARRVVHRTRAGYVIEGGELVTFGQISGVVTSAWQADQAARGKVHYVHSLPRNADPSHADASGALASGVSPPSLAA